MDYEGAMGVPITFLDKYNPKQFEILGNLGSYAPDGYSLSGAIYINGKKIFKRILIKNKNPKEQK
jgi:cytosine-specific methyltransferase